MIVAYGSESEKLLGLVKAKVITFCCQQKYKVFSESKRHEKVLWSPASRPRAPPTLRAERGSSSQATCT